MYDYSETISLPKINTPDNVDRKGVKNILKAKQNSKIINSFAKIDLESCEKEASDSLKEFDKINQEQEISFDHFIKTYNSKI